MSFHKRIDRDSIAYDVVIVGAGPAGLAAAIHIKQCAAAHGADYSVCVVEKGSEVGAHIISGALFDPRVLTELLPGWRAGGAPLHTAVIDECFLLLGKRKALPVPRWALPAELHNDGNYAISLANLCRWLADQAEGMGVEIYPGFAAAEVLFHEDGSVRGIVTGDMGIDKGGDPKPSFQPGMALLAKYTLFAEGCRGHLSRQLMERFRLRDKSQVQSYGLGVKELWEVDSVMYRQGRVMHTAGWPLKRDTYGGSFIYHLDNNQVAVGFVVGLDYQNPFLDPFQEFQCLKTHPAIRPLFQGGKRIAYGARTLNEGGWQSIPELVFPGGALIGCAAGFLNPAKIKGSHYAMKSGMLAAEAIADALRAGRRHDVLSDYPAAVKRSWVFDELYRARNFRPAFARWGLWRGSLYAAIDLKLLRGKVPWTLRHGIEDRDRLRPAREYQPIHYPKPDGKVVFDRPSSVYLSNTHHEEDQPVHLRLRDPDGYLQVNVTRYDGPEQRYCPAGVYELIGLENGSRRLQINASNCLHCKACDIKDPGGNIYWVPPEGGGGPNYPNM